MLVTKSPFKNFADELQQNFSNFVQAAECLHCVDVDPDLLWNAYLSSFSEAEGYRQTFNCFACRSFIKRYGGLVKIEDNQLVSIWNFTIQDPIYQAVANKLATMVEGSTIRNVFIPVENLLGIPQNNKLLADGSTITYYHFSLRLPDKFRLAAAEERNTLFDKYRVDFQLLKKALSNITIEATETALELIAQGSVELGTQFEPVLSVFLDIQKQYHELPQEPSLRDNYCWSIVGRKFARIVRIYNQAIGTFLQDLSQENIPLDDAVERFGRVMNPRNYKRPQGIYTRKTLESAQQTIEALGLTASLQRRLAITEDVSINNLLWVDRNTRVLETKSSDIFAQLSSEIPVASKQLKQVQEVDLERFRTQILPTCQRVEVLFDNNLINNLVSLIAPSNLDAPPITKWENGFSWVYYGGLASSIKEKVKAQGGLIQGILRCSLAWFNTDDLDLDLTEPSGSIIYFGNRKSSRGGELDVDMNVKLEECSRQPVENIVFPYGSNIQEGIYKLRVKNFTHREHVDVGFKVEIECQNKTFTFNYNQELGAKKSVVVAEFNYSRAKGVELIKGKGLPQEPRSQTIWNMQTCQFHPVSCIMHSPNHWGDNTIGNDHLFLMLKGAQNEDLLIRGFLNEQLPEHLLREHKRVFEVLGSRMGVEQASSEQQLSGLGFPLTQANSFTAKIYGASERTIKVKIK